MKMWGKALGVIVEWIPSRSPSAKTLQACGPLGFGLGTSLGTLLTMISPQLFHTLSQYYGSNPCPFSLCNIVSVQSSKNLATHCSSLCSVCSAMHFPGQASACLWLVGATANDRAPALPSGLISYGETLNKLKATICLYFFQNVEIQRQICLDNCSKKVHECGQGK